MTVLQLQLEVKSKKDHILPPKTHINRCCWSLLVHPFRGIVDNFRRAALAAALSRLELQRCQRRFPARIQRKKCHTVIPLNYQLVNHSMTSWPFNMTNFHQDTMTSPVFRHFDRISVARFVFRLVSDLRLEVEGNTLLECRQQHSIALLALRIATNRARYPCSP